MVTGGGAVRTNQDPSTTGVLFCADVGMRGARLGIEPPVGLHVGSCTSILGARVGSGRAGQGSGQKNIHNPPTPITTQPRV